MLSTAILLLTGCSDGDTSETEDMNAGSSDQVSEETESNLNPNPNSNPDSETNETEDIEIEEESSTDTEENPSDDQDQENTEMTEEEVEEKVIAYVNENKAADGEAYNYNIKDEGAVFTASMYAPVSTSELKGAPILSMFEINKATGEVKEIEVGPYDSDTTTSEIVSMSKEERNSHHRELAAEEGKLEDIVLEHLLLPGVHKNTKTYEGRINPGDTVELFLALADTPPDYEPVNTALDIDEEGYFTIDLSPYELENKSVLRFSIEGDYSEEQVFDVPIYEAQEGMESIGVRGSSE